MTRQIFHFVFAIAAALLMPGAPADATTLVRMSLAKMSRTAPLIVRGECLENSTSWDAGEIWTFTSFEVREVWRGNALARITVRLLGGRVGNLTSRVSGIPRFHPGEEVVLFLEPILEPTQRVEFSVVGWRQGSFRIHRDVLSGQESVTQDTASFPTFDPATRQFEMNGIRRLSIDVFRVRIDAALSGENGRVH